ncbi:MAG: TonB family protein [Elusimicrobiota bacterium]|jgi:protein TonB
MRPRTLVRTVLADAAEAAGFHDAALRPYFTYSAAAHAGLVLAFLLLAHVKGGKPENVYRIDFIGAADQIMNRNREEGGKTAPPAQAARPAPLKDPDAFNLKPHRPLPKPSFLQDASAAANPKPAKSAPAQASSSAPGAGEGTSVSADMPNFPYPWYLTGLRSALWDRWAARMPDLSGDCGIVFTLLRDGSVVDISIESSSGDSGFDYAALSAAREAAPFPPLPAAFDESFLKVHVRFRSGG